MNLKHLLLLTTTAITPISFALADPNPLPNPVAPRSPQSTGLLSDLPTIIDNLKELLSQDTIDNLETIVKGAAVLLGGDTPQNLQKLLASDNIDKLQNIINNADLLLTTSFVNETSELIGDALPLVTDVSALLTAIMKTA
ncbi:hypothetical protein ASPBRDRAFT_57158 [Aspergillus brasiliensis CBS 101740]|uniref:Uncharacterized protein n=1 Tax=Aspergillus brasiliensis (strain CBS 101740 / IMI 381727 / IBT 21946) TaxID=767769 RepID=A0A1L9UCU8_ASPBC|nr:hypothetical protein ASPBRDRAFT_57158 [Aspergillus brasiliensis CBS 101740]